MASKAKGKVPAKVEPKVDNKELEALKRAEEQRLLEEQRQREKEEARKKEMLCLSTGLTLYLNQYCVQEAWKHAKPKEFLITFVTRIFKDMDLINNFESIEISLIAEFHLYNLIFAKEELELDDQKTVVLLNLLWMLMINKNPFYEKKYDLRDYDNDTKEMIFAEKTLESDIQEFSAMLMNHCMHHPPNQLLYFSGGEAKRILEYVKNGYFMHFTLYRYILLNKQKDEEIRISVFVDKPLPTKPLSEGLYMGKEKHEIKEDDEDELRKEAEEIKKRKEEERQRQGEMALKLKEEDDNKLDPVTMGIIQARLKETEDAFNKQLSERERIMNEKLENIVNPKKKK